MNIEQEKLQRSIRRSWKFNPSTKIDEPKKGKKARYDRSEHRQSERNWQNYIERD